MLEARVEGHQPLAVTHHAATVAQAIDGAAQRMVHLLEHTLGRLHSHRGRGAALATEPDVPAVPEA